MTTPQEARRKLEFQLSGEKQRLAGEKAKAEARVTEQATTERKETARRYREASSAIIAAKRQAVKLESLEQRRRDLPISKPRDIGTASKLTELDKQAAELSGQLQEITAEIDTAEAKALADIEKQAREIYAGLDKIYNEQLALIKEYEASNIKLATGEWVSKEQYDALDGKAQQVLFQKGIKGYNEWAKTTAGKEVGATKLEAQIISKRFKESSIQLKFVNPQTGQREWVDKTSWSKLSQRDKDILNNIGVDAFNLYQRMTAGLEQAIEVQKFVNTVKYEANTIEVADGRVAKTEFEKLSTPDQALLKQIGVERYNRLKSAESEIDAWGKQILSDTGGYRAAVLKVIGDDRSTVRAGGIPILDDDDFAVVEGRAVGNWTQADYESFWNHLSAGEKAQIWNYYVPSPSFMEQVNQVAEAVVPGLYVARHWDELNNAERGANIILDLLIVVPALKGLKSISSVPAAVSRGNSRIAYNAGKASRELEASLRSLSKTKVTASNYTAVANKAQQAIQKSLRADMKFIDALSGLKKVTPAQLSKLEKYARWPGVKQAVLDVNAATRRLELAWKAADKYKWGSERYIRELGNVEKAKAGLGSALDKFYDIAKPRYKLTESPAEFKGYTANWKYLINLDELPTVPPKITTLREPTGKRPAVAVTERVKVAEPKPVLEVKAVYEKAPKVETKPTVPKVAATRKQFKLLPKSKVIPRVVRAAVVQTVVLTIDGVSPAEAARVLEMISSRPDAIELQRVRDAVQAITRAVISESTFESALERLDTQLEIEPMTRTSPKLKTLVKVAIKTALRELPKFKKVSRIKGAPPFIRIPGTDRVLTEKELEASVAWKQGFIYKLIYPPYGERNIINTREPIPGVKYHVGAKSAYRSLTKIYKGTLPPRITRDMGIMDIEIERGSVSLSGKKGKPKIKFRRDVNQRTQTTPQVGVSK